MSLIYLKNACDKCNALVTEEARREYLEAGKCPFLYQSDVYLKSGHIINNVFGVCDLMKNTPFEEMTLVLAGTNKKHVYINATEISAIGKHVRKGCKND